MNLRRQNLETLRAEIQFDASLPAGERQIVANNLVKADAIQRDIDRRLAKAERMTADSDGVDPDLCQPICVVTTSITRLNTPFSIAADFNHACSLDLFSWHDGQGGHAVSNFLSLPPPIQRLAGFNVQDFDLPVLRNWAVKMGFPVPEFLERQPFDVFQILTQHRKLSWPNHKPLKSYAAIYLSNRELYATPQDYAIFEEFMDSPFTGSDVPQAYLENRWDKIIRHCTLDCLMAGMLCRLFLPSGLRSEL